MSMLLEDARTGYAIDQIEKDEQWWLECGQPDADFGDPEGWPAWTDADRWEIISEPGYEPDADDEAALVSGETTPDEREEAMATLAMLDRLEEIYAFQEAELRNCGLPIG